MHACIRQAFKSCVGLLQFDCRAAALKTQIYIRCLNNHLALIGHCTRLPEHVYLCALHVD